MDKQDTQNQRQETSARLQDDLKLWSLSRIDIRSPVLPSAWPVARVELDHPVRGRVTDIGTAPGAFDAAFAAMSQILRVSPRLLSFNVNSEPPAFGKSLGIRIDIELEVNEHVYHGTSSGEDLVRCSVCAWLEAASRSVAGEEQATQREKRPSQVPGLDKTDGL